MNEITVSEIYENASIILDLDVLVDHIRKYMDIEAVDLLSKVFVKLTELCKRCITEDLDEGKALWDSVKELSVIQGDLIRVGDTIELSIIPLVQKYISKRWYIEEPVGDRFTVKSSISGYLTIYENQSGKYIHSKTDPMFEAYQYVKEFFDDSKRCYYVYGCGLGYEILQLYEIADGYTEIVLYEPDDLMYEAAMHYGVLSKVPKKSLSRKKFASAREFLSEAESINAGILIYAPIAQMVQNEIDNRELRTYLMGQNTDRRISGIWRSNCIRNSLLAIPNVQQYINSVSATEAIIVASGPSLSETVGFLRESMGKRMIITVGHSFRFLMERRIVPDCIVVIDPLKVTVNQIKGYESCRSPLLISENAYWKVADAYEGPKYMIRNWNYQGTVSAAALELAIRMNVKTVYLVGLDLGYPSNSSHAEGIEDTNKLDAKKLFPVDSVDGGQVMTDLHMDYYRKVIEEQIYRCDGIAFYNLSRHGAKINGTLNY